MTGAVKSVTIDGETVEYTYDSLGNILTETEGNTVKTYTYNYRGQQVGYSDGTTTATYAYNPSGLRSAKTVGGSTKYFVYNGMQIVFEYEDSVSDGTVYYYGLNRTHNSDGNVYVYNAHGDTVQLVNDNALAVSYTYDAFGNLINTIGESDNAFLYCSEYFDAETQTYYLRARYYNPANGRFTQQDAWAFMDPADPLTLNLYTYCANNPIVYFDYSGHVWALIALLAVGTIAITLTGCSSNSIPEYYSFNPAPQYDITEWNTEEYIKYTNCYAYAFNMLVNPVTGEKFPERGMQPGMLSGKFEHGTYEASVAFSLLYLAGTAESNAAFVELVQADMDAIGMSFVPYEEGMTGGYRVALVISPYHDYHWYRDNGDGTWSHKPGITGVTNKEITGVNADRSLAYGEIITDPQAAGQKAGYTVYLGIYYIKPTEV